jgi:hypothetical protein
MAQVMDLVNVRSEEGTATGRCLLCGEQENETHLLLKCTKTQRRREELLKNKRPNMTDEISLRQLLTNIKNTELKNFGTLA